MYLEVDRHIGLVDKVHYLALDNSFTISVESSAIERKVVVRVDGKVRHDKVVSVIRELLESHVSPEDVLETVKEFIVPEAESSCIKIYRKRGECWELLDIEADSPNEGGSVECPLNELSRILEILDWYNLPPEGLAKIREGMAIIRNSGRRNNGK